VKCSNFCLTCTSYSQCTTCDSSTKRVINLVNKACECSIPGYYDDNVTILCQLCNYTCATCFGPTGNNCYLCGVNRQFTAPFSCPCAPGFFESAGLCITCSAPCLTCSITATNCTSCGVGRYLSNFQCFCSTGYYINGLTCSQCDFRCQTCSTSALFCLTCNTTLGTIISGSTCICPDGKYMNTTTSACLPCTTICLTCSSNTDSSCLTCNPVLYRSFNLGKCDCNQGYYEANIPTCQICNPLCFTCNGPSVYNCTSCNLGYVLMGSVCMPTIVCSNYFYDGQCLSTCPITTYPSIASHLCIPCSLNCLTCLSAVVCLSCLSNTYYFANNQSCLSACPIGYYIALNSSCLACPLECRQCVLRNSVLVCSSCQTGLYLFNGNCTSNCPTSTKNYVILPPYCLPCLDGCLTCNSINTGDCLTCQIGYSLYAGMCLINCPEGYYTLNQICLVCDTSCTKCSNGKCEGCNAGYYLSKSVCTSVGYFIKEGQTLKCHPNCLTCTD